MSGTQTTLQQIEEILPQLQSRQLEIVLAFAEFIRYQAMAQNEEDVLWSFVEREQEYRIAHPEDVIVCDSDDALLAALDAET